MARKKPLYLCTSCGAEHPKWSGRCSVCNEWNTIVAAEAVPHRQTASLRLQPLSEIKDEKLARLTTGIGEFDLVTGGGMVPGSVILIGGDPGIGKSTLVLQIAQSFKTLYFSGEESPAQIRDRAERLSISPNNINVSPTTSVDEIVKAVENEKPECVIIDSIQTLYHPDIPGYAGSVSQIREAAARIVEAAKSSGVPVILVGHITKDGSIAGPKVLEHLVDTVLYFEGDFTRDFRVLRAFKNRFGSVNEIGLFRMTGKGLAEVTDKNTLFLNPFPSRSPGNAVSASIEGSRIILFEVQSLVGFSSFSNPRRMADGFDLNRLIIITAVLEKHALMKLGSFDVFINVAGGFRITETAADLAVAMAVASSLKNVPIPESTGFLGEIALSGEVRPVTQLHRRIQEFSRSGFETLVLSRSDEKEARHAGFGGEIIGAGTVAEAAGAIF